MNVLRFVPKVPTPPRLAGPRSIVMAAAGNHAPNEVPLQTARANLDHLGKNIAREILVITAVKDRLPPPPPKPAAPTLQDLVQQARFKLLTDRNRAHAAQLDAVSAMVGDLAKSLTPVG